MPLYNHRFYFFIKSISVCKKKMARRQNQIMVISINTPTFKSESDSESDSIKSLG